MPPWASGPVYTVSSPMRIGLPCAIAGIGSPAASAIPATPSTKSRRPTLAAILFSLLGIGVVGLPRAVRLIDLHPTHRGPPPKHNGPFLPNPVSMQAERRAAGREIRRRPPSG